MLRVAAGPIRFDYASGDARELERWLVERAGGPSAALPAGLKSLPGLGCRELNWQGRAVGLLCLKAGEGRALHIFALRSDTLPGAPLEGPARFAASGEMQTATWRRGGVIYLAALKGDDAGLRQSLGLRSL
jgi:hypothetical protein